MDRYELTKSVPHLWTQHHLLFSFPRRAKSPVIPGSLGFLVGGSEIETPSGNKVDVLSSAC